MFFNCGVYLINDILIAVLPTILIGVGNAPDLIDDIPSTILIGVGNAPDLFYNIPFAVTIFVDCLLKAINCLI